MFRGYCRTPLAAEAQTPSRSAARHNALYAALAAVAVLAASACFMPGDLPKLYICLFHRTTGLPCPGCGLTRSFCAISHGNFTAAWRFNPFGFLFYAGVLAVPFQALRKWRNPLLPAVPFRNWKTRWNLLLVLCLAMIAHNIWRICYGWR